MIKLLKIQFLCLVYCCTAICLKAQELDSALQLKVGTKLLYTYEIDNKLYRNTFIVEIKSITPTLSFHWSLSKPIIKSGNIEISKKALSKGSSFFASFSGGDLLLTNQTSMVLSRKLFRNLSKNEKKIKLSVNYGKPIIEPFFVVDSGSSAFKKTIINCNKKQILLKNYTLENNNKTKVVSVWDNASFPILLYLETDSKMFLEEIIL